MQINNLKLIPEGEIVRRWALDLYANAVDRQDAVGFAAAFTENGSLRFGNAPPLFGRAAIETAIGRFFTTFLALRHESRGVWLTDDTLILEALVTYTRHDAGKVSIPAVTIFHLAGAAPEDPERPLADECRIYVDLTPLYGPAT